MQTGFSGTLSGSSEILIGWKSRKTTYVPLWDRMKGAWLWTLLSSGSVLCTLYYCLQFLNTRGLAKTGCLCVKMREQVISTLLKPLFWGKIVYNYVPSSLSCFHDVISLYQVRFYQVFPNLH